MPRSLASARKWASSTGGYLSYPAKIATQLARTVTGTWQFRILGAKDNNSPDMAGFANSAIVRYLDYNDSSKAGLSRRNQISGAFPYHDNRCMATT